MSFSAFATRAARPAAVAAATGFVSIAAFQLCLALGADWGNAAWGGGEGDPSSSLRLASGLAAAVLVAAALVVLGRAGYWASAVPVGIIRWGIWVLVAAMTLSALANSASSSNGERYLMSPLALLLALLCLVVARGGQGETVEHSALAPDPKRDATVPKPETTEADRVNLRRLEGERLPE